jgi:hypothetical protein
MPADNVIGTNGISQKRDDEAEPARESWLPFRSSGVDRLLGMTLRLGCGVVDAGASLGTIGR